MKKLILIFVLGMALSSCTVYRTISFNADHSGNVDSKIDMTGLISMMGENGGAGSMGSMGDLAQMDGSRKMLESVSGISNVKVSYDTTGILYTSYEFATVEALTTALSTGGNLNMLGETTGENPGKTKITYKGKKFFMEEVDKKTLKSLQSEEKKKEFAQMEMLFASSEINTTINFPTEVKKVSYKNASITNGKSVNFVMPFKDYLSKDYKPLTVILK